MCRHYTIEEFDLECSGSKGYNSSYISNLRIYLWQSLFFFSSYLRNLLSQTEELPFELLSSKETVLTLFAEKDIVCHFSASWWKPDFGTTTREEEDISLEGQVVPRKDTFRYLGSMLRETGILMKMLAIESKQGGWSGAKHLMSYVTKEHHTP